MRTGLKLQGFIQDEGGVVAHFTDAKFGLSSETVRGDVLVGADGIHSVVRRHFHPKQGRPSWQGLMLWRGAAEWPKFLTGSSMYIAGGMSAKIALYPIAPGSTPDTRLTNWAIVSRIADGEITPPPVDSWSRVGPHGRGDPLCQALQRSRRRCRGAGAGDAGLLGISRCATATRCPIGAHGRVTLLGDAAHPMYPVGSNGAAQAILDARSLADWLRKADHPMQALHEYERDRLPKTAEIVRLNRKGGPERVIDEVEKLAPAGFESVDRVLEPRRARGDRQGLRRQGRLHPEPGQQVKVRAGFTNRGGSHPRAHPPELRKELDLQHALEVADAGRAASAPLEADDALDRRDVVETPASEIVLEVDQLFRELVEVPVVGGITVDLGPGAYQDFAFDVRLGRRSSLRGLTYVEAPSAQQQIAS